MGRQNILSPVNDNLYYLKLNSILRTAVNFVSFSWKQIVFISIWFGVHNFVWHIVIPNTRQFNSKNTYIHQSIWIPHIQYERSFERSRTQLLLLYNDDMILYFNQFLHLLKLNKIASGGQHRLHKFYNRPAPTFACIVIGEIPWFRCFRSHTILCK